MNKLTSVESSLIFPVGRVIHSEKIRKKAILNCKQSYKPLKGVSVISSSLYMDSQTGKPELGVKRTHTEKKLKVHLKYVQYVNNNLLFNVFS